MRLVLGLMMAALAVASAQAAPKPAPKAGPRAMVSAANPAAVEAGLKVLRAGGTAVDAAVAVQATLGLVEPQSSGLGGGAFLVFYDAATHKVTAYDGREIAPAGATPDMFLKPDGTPLPFPEAVLSGRSAGAPGAIAMLAMAHKDHGKRPWASLFGEGVRLGQNGFTVGPRLASMVVSSAPEAKAPDALRYFTKPDGSLVKAGDVIRNPAYAAMLRRIAAEGPSALLRGQVAADIVKRLSEGPLPGTMTVADLAAYKPQSAEALCRPYRVWLICAPNPPSGGIGTLIGMGLLARTDIASRGPADPQGWLQLIEAQRLMYADRDRYIGDPAFVRNPVEGLLDGGYLDARAKAIGDQAGPAPEPGHPAGAPVVTADATAEPGGTSSFAIVDRWGNVVAMTTTVESIFGDGRMVHGFFLNNQLTDFSFRPKEADGSAAANAVAPGKRPRSSMSPVIVLDREGHFVAAVGSPGGPAIIAFVMKALVGVLDWKLSMQDAIALPNVIARGPLFVAETDKFAPGVAEGLAAKGVTLRSGMGGEGSGLHGVMVRDGRLEGGADPRREGVARGY